MSMLPSSSYSSSNGSTKQFPSSKYSNNTTIEELLNDIPLDVGDINTEYPLRVFKHNWIDSMKDIRLLYKEGELNSLLRVDIPKTIINWLQNECSKLFNDIDAFAGYRRYEYVNDFDTNGIVYNIATKNGTISWTNPAFTQEINVLSSSIMHDSKPASSILGRELVRCVTNAEKNSWFLIDFTPRSIRPLYYTLKHYSSWDSEALRTWELQGSNDGIIFTTLKKHRNDTSLNFKGATHTWKIEGINTFYNMFRILQTDLNSNRHYFLSLSGFEIYGDLKDIELEEDDNNLSLTFLPSYDFDRNGIVFWLGTKRKTESWTNPVLRHCINVYASSLAPDSQPIHYAVGRECVRCVSEPQKNSWFCFDFKNVKIIPTHYSLRHYSSFDTECLRSWKLEGSNDTTNGSDGHWRTLSIHQNDSSINGKGGTHTWEIPSNMVQRQSFSKFRIFQLGPNSNHHYYLPCSGFEIYGTVVSGIEESQELSIEKQPNEETREFVFDEDLDINGLFYFLGCKGFQSQWSNPCEIGFIEVKSSSLMNDSRPLSSVCGRKAIRCVTKPHSNSWISVNLKDVKIKLTHYTLRHYDSWDNEALRFWNLEGSNDGISWILIKQHYDDRSLRKAGMCHTWPVVCNQYYNQFRIITTGRNSNNHWYLACSGMELYGTAYGGLVSQHNKVRASLSDINLRAYNNKLSIDVVNNVSNPLVFSFDSDGDDNGIVHWLGSNAKRESFNNPGRNGRIIVKSSPLMNDSTPPYTILGKDLVRCVTSQQKNSWFSIDFQKYAIMPTHYTLRHYASWDTEALRNWNFEGSCDGLNWTLLREHRRDASLQFKGQRFTWKLRKIGYFTQFRILQTDANSNNHLYLCLSGFEVYGHCVAQNTLLRWDQHPKNKSRSLLVDPIRNVVINNGSNDRWQSVKSKEALQFNNNGIASFSVLLERVTKTSNSWKYIVGVAPYEFSCTGNKQWLGSQRSWGYIGATGGKCFNATKSEPYGLKYGDAGDCIRVILDCNKKSIEYVLNGKSQGIAYQNIDPTVRLHAAVSFTGTGSGIRLMSLCTPRNTPIMFDENIKSKLSYNPNRDISYHWNNERKSQKLKIFEDGITVTNTGSNDTWQTVISKSVLNSGKYCFEIEILNDVRTANSWKWIIGVVPLNFDPNKSSWIGANNSWGYIGNGCKIYQVAKALNYGNKYGKAKDVISVILDFRNRSIEFFKNGRPQGIAFRNLIGPISPAISITGTNASARIKNVTKLL